jgi:hypothetical protein
MTAPQDPYAQLPGGRLDPALDPDRYDPARADAGGKPAAEPLPTSRLDPALDPDRYDPARQPLVLGKTGGTEQTLPDLLAEGSFEDRPSPYMFLLGLAGIAAFLLLVAFVFTHLSP